MDCGNPPPTKQIVSREQAVSMCQPLKVDTLFTGETSWETWIEVTELGGLAGSEVLSYYAMLC